MNKSSFKASLWFAERTPDFYFWIISFISLVVICSALKMFTLMIKKSTEIKYKYEKWQMWTIFGGSILIIAMFLSEIIYRMIDYYGVQPYHTDYTWKFNLFTSFLMIVMLSLWIFKGWINGQWLQWRTDFFSWRLVKSSCKLLHLNKYTDKWAADAVVAKKTSTKGAGSLKEVASPATGTIKDISKVKDEVFSKKLLGDGIAIVPEDGEIVSPVDGTIESAFHTGHAFGIKTKDGLSILIHIGIDTVKLDGKGFKTMIKQGDKVKKGQLLSKVDFAALKKKKYITDVIVVVLPESGKKITTKKLSGKIVKSKTLFKVK